MAFSTTVRGAVNLGPGLRIVYGEWSGNIGDAAGTITIGGKYTGSLWFKSDTTTTNANQSQIFPSVQWDGNSNPGTLTVQNQDNVTTGFFLIFTLGQ